jgi:hypothetical protein
MRRLIVWACDFERRPVMNGNILNRKGIHVGTVTGATI